MNMPRQPNHEKEEQKQRSIPYRVGLNDMGKENMSRYHAVIS
jgi:hypothetical protein